MTHTVELNKEAVDTFFRDARERHAIYLRRRAGMPRPWTDDPVMQNYRITNLFRELDKTTTWLRENVRDPLRNEPLVLPAVALARWFNLIRTMETLFMQPSLFAGEFSTPAGAAGGRGGAPEPLYPARVPTKPASAAALAAGLLPGAEPRPTPWQEWMLTEDTRALEWALRKQGAPWVTGAYMIRTPIGMDKLEGVLSSFRNLWNQKPKFKTHSGYVSMGWREVAEYCLEHRDSNPVSLHTLWEWLKNFYGLGAFMAYEVVTDLRHTALLDRAPDINTWANPGPGALRGANILIRGPNRVRKGRLEKSSVKDAEACMSQLLELSRKPEFWPQPSMIGPEGVRMAGPCCQHLAEEASLTTPDWPEWELHEVEMWLCETAKLVRTRLGWGRPRGNF